MTRSLQAQRRGFRATSRIGAAMFLTSWFAMPAGAAAPDSPVALVGARIITLAGEEIAEGVVVMRGGEIVQVSAGRTAPAGARAIDATGKIITPGLIAANTRLGVVEISLERTTVDSSIAEGDAGHNHAAFRVADGFNPRSVLLPVTLLEGVTSSITAPDGALIAGQSAWVDLAEPTREQMLIADSLAMHAYVGGNVARDVGATRGWVWIRLREMLDDARTYARTRALYDRNQSRVLAGSRLALEALGRVVRREIPLVIHADRESDLATAIDFAREQKVRIILDGACEAWRIADRLAKEKIPVLISPTDNLPSGFDLLGSRLDNAALLHAAGVQIGISMRGETHNARTLRQRAGIAASYGLPQDAALAAASRNIAQIFGLAKEYGTVERGKVANLVVWSGDPLELSTRAEKIFVQGKEMPLISRQTELRDRYRKLPVQ